MKSALVFDPFSEDFFNGPYDIYRRTREDTGGTWFEVRHKPT